METFTTVKVSYIHRWNLIPDKRKMATCKRLLQLSLFICLVLWNRNEWIWFFEKHIYNIVWRLSAKDEQWSLSRCILGAIRCKSAQGYTQTLTILPVSIRHLLNKINMHDHQPSTINHQTSNIRHPTSDIRHPTSNIYLGYPACRLIFAICLKCLSVCP